MNSLEPLTTEELRKVALFADLGAEALALLQPNIVRRRFHADEVLLKSGQYFDGAYYLLSGTIEVQLPSVRNPSAIVLEELPISAREGLMARVTPGEVFGEGSALSRFPIVSDFRAGSDGTCLLIRTAALRAMFDLPELSSFKEEFDRRYKARTLRAHLQRVELLSDVDPSIIETLISRADLLAFKPGKRIVEQGAPCDALYLVRGGYVKVSVGSGSEEVAVSYLRIGDWIGEASLLLDEPWPVSLTAVEHVELVKLSRTDPMWLLPGLKADRRMWDQLVSRLRERGRAAADPAATQAVAFSSGPDPAKGLVHGESVLLIDLSRCTRCDECVRACADAHDGIPRFVREGLKFRDYSVVTACYHCTDPVCMIGCPTGAISRPLGTREVAVDQDTCIGCGNCVRRCPWGNILTVPYDSPKVGGPIDLATKCDLCIGRPEGPACVQMCPQGCAERVDFKHGERVEALLAG
jgi:Fe-S-cluster-containing hydrogenase component 2/CRP-like cAMP-binding protein